MDRTSFILHICHLYNRYYRKEYYSMFLYRAVIQANVGPINKKDEWYPDFMFPSFFYKR